MQLIKIVQKTKLAFHTLVERSKKDNVSSLNCDAKIFVIPINTKNRYKKTLV